jgi:flagellar hook-associated protein 2
MVQRVSGLASGIDTESIIQKLMQSQRIPVDRLSQKKTTIEWQRQDLLDMNTKLYDFRNNKLSNFKLEGNLSARKVELSGDSDVVSVKASGDAQPGTLIIKVKALATAASNYSSQAITAGTFDPTATLASQQNNLAATFSDNTITINDSKPITFDPNKESLNDVIAKINKETNVTAFYDTITKKISLVSKQTGEVNGPAGNGDKITFTGTLLTNAMQLKTAGVQEIRATNAEVFINDMYTFRSSNTFQVSGAEITLKKVSARTNPADPTTYTGTTISITTDVDKIVDSVKSFISDYNDMLKTLQDKIGEKKYRDYTPLTAEQKKDMKEADIKLWESKAKSGTLRNENSLSNVISGMRSAASAQVSNGSKYNTLSAFGIETGAYSENGKLYLKDETKLRKAIETDPQAFTSFFSSDGKGDPNKADVGIAERMYTAMEVAMKDIKQKSGTSALLNDQSILGLQMTRLNQQIDDGNQRLTELETRYYKKFAAMEQAIQKYNQQSAQLTNAFS